MSRLLSKITLLCRANARQYKTCTFPDYKIPNSSSISLFSWESSMFDQSEKHTYQLDYMVKLQKLMLEQQDSFHKECLDILSRMESRSRHLNKNIQNH